MDNDIIKVEIPLPEIPEDWNFDSEDKKFDELIFGWRRLNVDTISTLWIFYNKLKIGHNPSSSQNCDLPTWMEWLESKGIAPNTPLNHFKKLGWIDGKPHVSYNSGENEWYTPEYIIESAKLVMGNIDLDPASSKLANKTIKAKKYFDINKDGLQEKWTGNIWLNPPYSQPLISQFSEKINAEINNFTQACILTNNATETEWYQNILINASVVCFLKGRIKFIDINGNPSGAPLQGQSIIYIGKNTKEFYNEFNKYGICLRRII